MYVSQGLISFQLGLKEGKKRKRGKVRESAAPAVGVEPAAAGGAARLLGGRGWGLHPPPRLFSIVKEGP